MNRKDFENLAKTIFINNQVLQCLLMLQIGEKDANKVYKLIVKDVNKIFRKRSNNVLFKDIR